MTLRDKPIEQLTENDIKEMFLDLFFWVAENRPEWLQEAINRKKKQLNVHESARGRVPIK